MKNKKNLIVIEKGAICTVIINNPNKRNALTHICFFDIVQTFDDLSRGQNTRAVSFTISRKKLFGQSWKFYQHHRRQLGLPVKKGRN
jgi:enoyl-CoA hydratase/carnithine racemase